MDLLTNLFLFCKEVKDILQNVVLRNMVRESMHIKKELFEAWRRVTEVTLASCPADILPKDTRQTVIAEVLQDLLSKVHYKGYFNGPFLALRIFYHYSGNGCLHRH